MPRLFTGLPVPENIAFELSLLRGGIVGARWIEPEDYHITLRFIGDVDSSLARDIASCLGEIQRHCFALTIDGYQVFGGDRPRALVARVQNCAELNDMQAEHERLMRRLGLAPEVRKFTPHVTLARLRKTGAPEVAHYLGTRGLFESRSFTVRQFVLYSARDSVGGGPYVIEAGYPLG